MRYEGVLFAVLNSTQLNPTSPFPRLMTIRRAGKFLFLFGAGFGYSEGGGSGGGGRDDDNNPTEPPADDCRRGGPDPPTDPPTHEEEEEKDSVLDEW
jgi:hypothetical protein